MFNPSSRKSCKIKRYCSHCDTHYQCDGSCGNNRVIEDERFCFCPSCWENIFGSLSKSSRDEVRAKCILLENYLKAQGKWDIERP